MITVLSHVLWLSAIVAPVVVGLLFLFKGSNDASRVPVDAETAFKAEKEADARLQPFNGGAR